MNKQNISKFFKNVQKTLTKRTPEILTGIGIAGMCTTTFLAVKATPKALRLMEEAEMKKEDDLTAGEKFKACWKCYIPAAVTGGLSVCCLIGASSVNLRRNAALATAYKLSETALTEYREQVVETIGDKKEQLIREKVAEKQIEKNPVSKNEVVVTEKGNTLCYDAISGRYFKSDIEQIKKAVNELNRRMLNEMYISLNEFYYEIGLDYIKIGDDIGWNVDKGLIDIDFGSRIADDGTPCIVINYSVAPKYGYDH